MIRKDWIELPPDSEGYKDGVDYFLDIAYTKGIVEGIEILCPCAICCNDSWEERDVVYDHLCSKGFVKGYLEWIYHGEDKILMDLDSSSDDKHHLIHHLMIRHHMTILTAYCLRRLKMSPKKVEYMKG
ncbi:hypothetical protein P8452_37893 [Trifolium repens]|nr:hypothetical protein QL285_061547 [Trifolium repens]WJX51724.1 hypothetical protein P8452_37893 [Trifolium repens]